MNIKKKLILTIFTVLIVTFICNKAFQVYEYIDFDNKRGTSRKCYTTDDGLFCEIKNKTIGVKQYGLKE